jgi:hypothetical protein
MGPTAQNYCSIITQLGGWHHALFGPEGWQKKKVKKDLARLGQV